MKHMLLAISLTVMGTSSAFAAEKCYEQVPVPAHMACPEVAVGKSVDFVQACQYVPARIQELEVECQGKWINVAAEAITHAQACSAAGLHTTNIDGQICASGERRPATGEGAGSISYRHGRSGGGEGGGTSSVTDTLQGKSFCYSSDQERNAGDTDRVVAYACQ
ncbi:hypothetical protein G6L37_05845 [Agrobacterium rubi]|nr:hypothetical protein [Agrobacterium rubi]NTF24882.1 hypothetical protein [Agrobacterium rubi]